MSRSSTTFADLLDGPCAACHAGTPRLDSARVATLTAALGHGWEVEGDRLAKEFRFPDFAAALAYVVALGALSDAVGHHPEVHLGWGRARVEIWTHAVGGLTETDFAWAARAEAIPRTPTIAG